MTPDAGEPSTFQSARAASRRDEALMDRRSEHPRAALDAYLDGELSLEGSLAVESHLAACELCRRDQDTLGALRQILRSEKRRAAEIERTRARSPGAAFAGRWILTLTVIIIVAASLATMALGWIEGAGR